MDAIAADIGAAFGDALAQEANDNVDDGYNPRGPKNCPTCRTPITAKDIFCVSKELSFLKHEEKTRRDIQQDLFCSPAPVGRNGAARLGTPVAASPGLLSHHLEREGRSQSKSKSSSAGGEEVELAAVQLANPSNMSHETQGLMKRWEVDL